MLGHFLSPFRRTMKNDHLFLLPFLTMKSRHPGNNATDRNNALMSCVTSIIMNYWVFKNCIASLFPFG